MSPRVKVQTSGEVTGPIAIGIDQSYTGFALTIIGGGNYHSVVRNTAPCAMPIDRLVVVRTFLREWFSKWQHLPVTSVAMEGYGYSSMQGFMLGELGGMVKMEFFDNFPAYPYPLIVTPNQLKKYATGKGTSKKQEVMLAVYKTWGVEFSDDNMADAYVLAQMANGWATNKVQSAILEAVNLR